MTGTQQLAGALFGPDYLEARFEEIGLFEISNRKSLDVKTGDSTALPPGGYVLRYSSGEYLAPGQPETFVGGTNGLVVRWKDTEGQHWDSINFPDVRPHAPGFTTGWEMSHLVAVEFMRPNHMSFVPPKSAVGTVKIRIIRFIPKFLG